MSRRLHIATLGLYRNNLVAHVLARRGADAIAFIYTEENDDDLQKMKSDYEAKGIKVVAKKVEPWDYNNILAGILAIVSQFEEEKEEYDIEFGISCGTRVMTSAAYRASLFTDSPVYFMTNPYGEEPGEMIEVQPVSVAMLTQPKRNILEKLELLGGSANSQKELGSCTDLKASSISKHVNSLDAAGYISKMQDGRKTQIELTELGKIVLNLKKYRKSNIWGSGTDEKLSN